MKRNESREKIKLFRKFLMAKEKMKYGLGFLNKPSTRTVDDPADQTTNRSLSDLQSQIMTRWQKILKRKKTNCG